MSTSRIPSQQEIQEWVVAKIAEWAEIPSSSIEPGAALAGFGLDSVAQTTLYFELEEWLEVQLEPGLLENTTVEGLASRLHQRLHSPPDSLGGAGQ